MKKISTLLFAMLTSIVGFSQVPITIEASDVPLPDVQVNFMDLLLANVGNPIPGLNQTWNYGASFSDSVSTAIYPPETNPLFTSAGVDFSTPSFKGLTSTLGYNVTSEIDFNANGIYEAGLSIQTAAFSLGQFSGNFNDTLSIPLQEYLFTSPKIIMEFPYTIGSSWESVSRRTTDFVLTVSLFGLNHVPGQQVYTNFRKDTIIGWGKMRVYTPNGPSIPYEVLMDKVAEYNVDSFYLAGSPASPLLLSAFGVNQGQHTDVSHFYRFTREGSGSYPFLAGFFYGNDATYTTQSDIRINTENLSTATNDPKEFNYSTLVFPNPSNTSEINIKFLGREFSLSVYMISDMQGRIVQQGEISTPTNDLVTVSFNNQILNGTYMVSMSDKNGRIVMTEKIELLR